MMRIFYGLGILIVVGVIVMVGGSYYVTSRPFDFKIAKNVAKFNETYAENCVGRYKQQLSKTGSVATEEQLTAADAACKCARDPIVSAFVKRPVMTIGEIANAMSDDPELLAITKTCAEAAGMAAPQ